MIVFTTCLKILGPEASTDAKVFGCRTIRSSFLALDARDLRNLRLLSSRGDMFLMLLTLIGCKRHLMQIARTRAWPGNIGKTMRWYA